MSEFLREQLIRYLKENARGRQNAISRDILLSHLKLFDRGLNDRDLREMYSDMGIPSCEHGIFWPTTTEDLLEFQEYMKKKAIPHFERVRRVFQAFPKLAPQNGAQMELF